MRTPRHNLLRPIAITLRFCLLASAALYIVVFLWLTFVQRIPYPYELEWMEGGSVAHVQRILEGTGLYCPPSEKFVPYIYTPLYYYVSAIAAKLIGLGFLPLRLVSALSTLGAAFVIMQIVMKKFSAPFSVGFIAAGFFLASFRVTGAWFDVARVDALFVFLIVCSIYLLRSRNPLHHSLLSAVFMFLAFFTKQTALLIAIPLSVWSLVFRRGWYRLVFPSVFFFSLFISTFVMNELSNGWYSYYVFSLPRQHPMEWSMLYYYWTSDIFRYAAIACVFSAFCLFKGFSDAQWDEVCFDFLFLGSMLFASWFSRLHSGGYPNVLLPAYTALTIYFARGLHLVISQGGNGGSLLPTAYVAAVIQFLCLFYLPWVQMPSDAAKREGDRFLQVLASIPGDVFMPSHPWYPAMIGKSTCAHSMAVADILRSGNSDEKKYQLQRTILQALSAKRFGALVFDRETEFFVEDAEFVRHSAELRNNYVLVDEKLTSADFTVVTGMQTRPMFLYLRKNGR